MFIPAKHKYTNERIILVGPAGESNAVVVIRNDGTVSTEWLNEIDILVPFDELWNAAMSEFEKPSMVLHQTCTEIDDHFVIPDVAINNLRSCEHDGDDDDDDDPPDPCTLDKPNVTGRLFSVWSIDNSTTKMVPWKIVATGIPERSDGSHIVRISAIIENERRKMAPTRLQFGVTETRFSEPEPGCWIDWKHESITF